MAEDPRLRVLPDIHGHAKGEHKPFAEERPIPYSARLIFLWFYHAARRGAPRYMMVTDHVNYLTFEDPAAVNLVRRALRLAGAGDVLGAAEAAGVDIAQAQVVSDALRGGMRFTIGAEVDNDPRSRPDAPNVVDAMRPDGIIRSIHFLPIAHPQSGDEFFWPFDNPEFAHLFETVGVAETWERYIDLLVEAVATQPTHIVGHLHVPGKFGHWCEPAKLEEYENRVLDLCSERDIAIELNARVFYRSNDEAHKARHVEIYRRMLHKAKERDVGVALGSDAHSPRDQGRGFDILLRLLDETETNEIVFPIAGKHARVALRPDQVRPRPRVLAAAAAAAAAAKAEAEAAAIAKAEAEANAAAAAVSFERTAIVSTVESIAATATTPAEIITTTTTLTESVAVAVEITAAETAPMIIDAASPEDASSAAEAMSAADVLTGANDAIADAVAEAEAEAAFAAAEETSSGVADPMIGDLVTAVPAVEEPVAESANPEIPADEPAVESIIAATVIASAAVPSNTTEASEDVLALAETPATAVAIAEPDSAARRNEASASESDDSTAAEDHRIAAKRNSARDRRKEGDAPLPVITGDVPARSTASKATVHAAKPKSQPHGGKSASAGKAATVKSGSAKPAAVKAAVGKIGDKIAPVKGSAEKAKAVKSPAKTTKSASSPKAGVATPARSAKNANPATKAIAAVKTTANKSAGSKAGPAKSSSKPAAKSAGTTAAKTPAAKAAPVKTAAAKSVSAKPAAKSAAAKSTVKAAASKPSEKSGAKKPMTKSSAAQKSVVAAKPARKPVSGAKAR